ncbi:MAG: 3-deoxy-D-manno-octulosonic acid transferase, partial [Gemmatimonadaceae bacterium]
LWMHAPSVGEGLQARPVLERVREKHPDILLAYTFFSPSAEQFAAALDVDFYDYLPFDSAHSVRTALSCLRPSALVFSKLDVWPVLVNEAARRGVRLGLASATLAEVSGRRSKIASTLLRDAYASLDAVGAVGPDDAERLVQLGVRRSSISVTGDTRYDQVWSRAITADLSNELLAPLASDRPTLVAGSTWPADEERLLPAWGRLLRTHPEARLIIAPHEPTPDHLGTIERWAAERAPGGLRISRLGAAAASSADVVLVDRLGVLGDLYGVARVAYVGGGFHDAGLHSVLEPAAFGVPVIFGPVNRSSRDARLMLDDGAGVTVSKAEEIEQQIRLWLENDSARQMAGNAARDVVRRGLGATEKTLSLVEALVVGA